MGYWVLTIFILAVFYCILIWHIHRKRKRALAQFLKRMPQKDEEFVLQCGIDSSDGSHGLAIGIRKVFGKLGGFDGALIYASDKFDLELEHLKFSESYDSVEFGQALFDETQIALDTSDLEILPDPEIPPKGMMFKDFVRAVIKVCQRSMNKRELANI